MQVDELVKMFSKQFTFVNKLANDKAQPQFIKSENVQYVDDIKAK